MPSADATTREPGSRTVSVLLPLPLAGPYDYRVGPGTLVSEGDFVTVPLGPRQVTGVVWGPAAGDVDAAKLRMVTVRLDAPALPGVLRRFVDWVANYTVSPSGSVLRMAMSVPSALQPARPQWAYQRAPNPPPIRLTAARRRVLALLADGPSLPAPALAREAGVSTSVISGLATRGALEMVPLAAPGAFETVDPTRPGVGLSGSQAAAAAALTARVRAGEFSVTLLDGVTGSGKTEVYFEAVAAALRSGKQVLVLLPEIALTPQWLARFVDRFGAAPAVWHSDLNQAIRRSTWLAVAAGAARIVVGARSALFLPFRDLGLLVVDEEHEMAFKQEDGVAYQGRNMAVVRGQLGDAPVVLVSATPSLETIANVRRGRYALVSLPDRHGAALPTISAIDLREHLPRPRTFLSPPLRAALEETYMRGEQALLFLNRRGYAPLTLCRRCGFRLQCPNCTAWLVEHRFRRQLQCHHCGHHASLPPHCSECEAPDSFAACGPGVERIAEETTEVLPEAQILVVTSDTVRGPKASADLMHQMLSGEVDVLIGTQMVAKGHHFPDLTLVGVVDADLGLNGGDLRAAERTYQLLHQVSGRAGRADRSGQVLLQTYLPEHPVMQALVDGARDRFVDLQLAERRDGGWPPYGRLAAVVVSGPDVAAVDQMAGALGRAAPRFDGVRVLGPAPAPLAVLRGRHRRRLLLKTREGIAVQSLLRAWLARIPVPGSVRVHVDVDPYSFT